MTKAAEKELASLEKGFWKAMKDRDIEAMVDMSDIRTTVTGPQGVATIGKEQLREMMARPGWSLESYSFLGEPEVRMVREDLGVVSYRLHEEMVVEGRPVSLEVADSSVWVRKRGKWVCTLHSEAIMGDPFGRDRTPTIQ